MTESLGSAWRRARLGAQCGVALPIRLVLLVPAWGAGLPPGTELYLLVLLIALLLLGKPLYGLFWRGLEGPGVHDAQRRWERQPRWIKVLPLVAAIVLSLLIVWGRGTQPSLSLVILIGIIFALYVLPPHVRQYVIPVTVLAFAVAVPDPHRRELALGRQRAHLHESAEHGRDGDRDRLRDDGARPEHGSRLRRAARPRLRRVLRHRGLCRCLVRLASLRSAGHQHGPAEHRRQLRRSRRVPGVGGIHISIWLVLLIGAAITAVAGVLIGLPTLRLRGDYLAIVTLGFGEMVAQVARNGDELQLGFNLTNGPPGINPVDSPGFGSWLHDTLGLPATS